MFLARVYLAVSISPAMSAIRAGHARLRHITANLTLVAVLTSSSRPIAGTGLLCTITIASWYSAASRGAAADCHVGKLREVCRGNCGQAQCLILWPGLLCVLYCTA